MPVDARAAIGAKLKVEFVPGSGNFVEIAGVSSINGLSLETQVVDVTAHDTVGRARRKKPTLNNYGRAQFTLFYDPAEPTHNAQGLRVMYDQGYSRAFQLHIAEGDYYEDFEGFVASLGSQYPVDGVVTQSVSIEVDGASVLTEV